MKGLVTDKRFLIGVAVGAVGIYLYLGRRPGGSSATAARSARGRGGSQQQPAQTG